MKSGVIAYFVGNPVAAKLLMVFLILGGIIGGLNLNVRLLPELDLRTISVSVAAPGSSPKEVEEDINRRIEESIVGLAGVARVVSIASEGVGRLEAELDVTADADAVLSDVKNAIGAIENFPPVSADPPTVRLAKVSAEILTLSVSSTVMSEDGLRSAAERVRDELISLPSVSLARLGGTRDREIAIEMNEEELRRLNLSISEIASKVRRTSLNQTFGELRTDAGGIVLNVIGKRRHGEEFRDVPLVVQPDGSIVKLGDVAKIRDGFVDDRILSEVDGKPTVFVSVEAFKNQSFIGIRDSIEDWLASYEPPPGIEVAIWSDRVTPIFDRFSEIIGNAVIGALLVFACLVLVFDLRFAIWIAAGIPITFIGSLMFFGTANLTLNMVSLFAFFMLIGIVVDDAVVVGESIAKERERGKRGVEAAISGARAVLGPITVGLLTTLLAFLPFLFITSGNYQILHVLPYVVFFVLFISLVEAFCILPSHLSHEGRWSLAPLRDIQAWTVKKLDVLRDAIVVPAVSWSIRHVFLTFMIGVAILLASVFLVRSELVQVVVFDTAANRDDTIKAELELPVGTPFETTAATARQFANAASAVNEQFEGTAIKSISLVVGNLGGAAGTDVHRDDRIESHLASVKLQLHERPLRKASPEEIERQWRKNAAEIYHLEKVHFQNTRVRFKPSIAYALVHEDADVLSQAASELGSFLKALPAVYSLSDSLSPGKRHFTIELTPVGEASGLTPAMVGKQLRSNFHGLEVQRIQRGHDEVRVMVRYPAERRGSLKELASERIILLDGKEIPLSTIARITEETQLENLIRIDGKQAVLVNAQVDLSESTPIRIRRELANEFLPQLVSKYPGLTISRDAGARDERILLNTLGVLIPITLIAMYGLMAAFLRSYWKPLVATAGIPMAFAGAVFGHWILGWNLTIISVFGMIGVAGVIVNDALLLLDRYNAILKENSAIPAIAAASAATRDRFRAVFLTTVTTVLGLSPLLYERGDELIFLVPFAVSMLGGLIAASVFTLFFLPAIVMFVEDRRGG